MQLIDKKRTRKQIILASQFTLATLIEIGIISSPIAWLISAFIFAWSFLKSEEEEMRSS
ncbi:MAG: hypothetical protein SWY16_11495 [Cyanobacteriota bacterium]|nr:hypothetical protein [Cyanobacteriota bacterium]